MSIALLSAQEYLALTEELLSLLGQDQLDLFAEKEVLRNQAFERMVANRDNDSLSSEMRAIVEEALIKNGLLEQQLISRHEELQNLLAQTRTQQKITAAYR